MRLASQRYRARRRGGKPDRRCLTDPQALALMKSIHVELKVACGSQHMHREQQHGDHPIPVRRVWPLMREHGIRARHKRRYKATPDSEHSMPVAPDLLSSNFTPEAPNRVWASDIPSSQTGEGWPYVAIVPPSWPKPPIGTASVKTSVARAVTIGMSPCTPH